MTERTITRQKLSELIARTVNEALAPAQTPDEQLADAWKYAERLRQVDRAIVRADEAAIHAQAGPDDDVEHDPRQAFSSGGGAYRMTQSDESDKWWTDVSPPKQ